MTSQNWKSFLGYGNNSKGYRIYNPSTKNIIICRNVKFDKFSSWNWENSKEKPQTKYNLE